MDSNQYFEQKRNLLKECVSISEDILSKIEDIDRVNELLSARSDIISRLQELEEAADGNSPMKMLSDSQNEQLDQLIALLLGLDGDTAKKNKKRPG